MSTSASNRTWRWSWRWRRSFERNWLGCLPFDVARVRDGKARSRIFIGRLKACGMHWMAQSLLDTPTSPRYGAHPPEQHPSSIHCLPRSSEKPFVERHPSIRFDLDTQVALAWKEGARGGSGRGSRGETRRFFGHPACGAVRDWHQKSVNSMQWQISSASTRASENAVVHDAVRDWPQAAVIPDAVRDWHQARRSANHCSPSPLSGGPRSWHLAADTVRCSTAPLRLQACVEHR